MEKETRHGLQRTRLDRIYSIEVAPSLRMASKGSQKATYICGVNDAQASGVSSYTLRQ
jgi:hypothetical protein